MEEKNILDNIIVGRVKPYIYAFTTSSVPDYLKIGDTYRPIKVRMQEWRAHYPDLKEVYKEEATIDDDVFFRDYSVHDYIEGELKKRRLMPSDIDINKTYYSSEFFKNATSDDIKNAIKDIKENYRNNTNKYKYYDSKTKLPEEYHYANTEKWKPRPNQDEVVRNFRKARENGRNNLLMYAVMRFGKSFTSMLCALDMDAKIVLVVSAKADVKEEWKKTVESIENFKDFEFITSNGLLRNENKVKETLSNEKKVVIFLTLQDLQGDKIKEKHKEIFENNIDLLIIDETHFGARAEKYGKILKENNCKEDVTDKHKNEIVELEDISKETKQLKAKIKLHLSGTPYRILMGSEFSREDIIGFCQFSDIVKAQKKWDDEHITEEEWENPYYGFPQMIRFAFNPNESTRKKLEELKSNGKTYAFHALLEPKSIRKNKDGLHKKFVNEKEILELLQAIDGSKEDSNVFGFLNYDKIIEGEMCRHIVFVLPYCASCDAMEELIKSNKDKFKNLDQYEIINISGVENPNLYKTVKDVKNKIKECEKDNNITITLTVNRMLTGSTVEQWDTMVYLKDTLSPQEYDQAIFRLQNQYIDERRDKEGGVVKYNMKPQTILVDFDPNRMFLLQEQKALIYNVNSEETGNTILKKELEKELEISPIITMNKSRIKEITPKDIMEVVSEYSRNKGVLEETNAIPVDLSLLNYQEIRDVIERQAELGSKQSLFVNNTDEEGEELEFPEETDDEEIEDEEEHDNENVETNGNNNANDPVKQFRTYYARILFYSFLTESNVISLDEIIESIESNITNKKLAKNLGLDVYVLKSIRKHIDWAILNQLEYKIQNINNLSKDTSITPIERAKIAVNKFNKLSDSEIVTPDYICKDMINLISKEDFRKLLDRNGKFIDIASTMGEFSLAIYERAIREKESVDISKNIYAIPTSSIAFEFTKKIYKILGLDINNIARMFNSYDFLKIIKDKKVDYKQIKAYLMQDKKFSEIELEKNMFYEEGEGKVKFDVVVGNPPYQLKGGSGGNNDALIFQHFANIAEELDPEFISLIIPSRWFSGGRSNLVGDFRSKMLNNRKLEKMVVFSDASEIFDNVEIKGGVCYYLINKNYDGDCNYTLYQDNRKEVSLRNLNNFDILIREPKVEDIVRKVIQHTDGVESVEKMISNDTPFGIGSNPKTGKKYSINVFDDSTEEHNTKLFFIEKQKRRVEYVSKNEITKNSNDVDLYKVFIPANAGSGNDPYIIGKPELAERNSVCSQSYLYAAFEIEEEAVNFVKYMKTKFFRLLVKAAKITQGASSKVYRFVPKQDFSNNSDINWYKDIENIDHQLGEKYELEQEEMEYINNTIKPLE